MFDYSELTDVDLITSRLKLFEGCVDLERLTLSEVQGSFSTRRVSSRILRRSKLISCLIFGLVASPGRFSKSIWSKIEFPETFKHLRVEISDVGPHHSSVTSLLLPSPSLLRLLYPLLPLISPPSSSFSSFVSNSWSLDHLLSIPTIQLCNLQTLSITRSTPPFSLFPAPPLGHEPPPPDDVCAVKPIPEVLFEALLADGVGLRVLELDWWEVSSDQVSKLAKTLVNLEKFKFELDAPFAKLVSRVDLSIWRYRARTRY